MAIESSVESAKKAAELSKKLNAARREVRDRKNALESDLRFGRDTTKSRIDLKYAAQREKSVRRELEKYT